MSDIFKKIISFFFKKQTDNACGSAYFSSGTSNKTVLTAHESMEINSSYDEQVSRAEDEIESLIKANFNEPENLFSYIRTAGTKIYKIGSIAPILKCFKIQTGYIPVLVGIKAGVLNLFLNKKIDFEIHDIFLTPALGEKHTTFFYKFYMWYFYKNNLLYTDEKIANLVFELDNEDNRAKIPTLSYSEAEIVSKIVKTDMRAIKFAMAIVESITKAKELTKKSQEDV